MLTRSMNVMATQEMLVSSMQRCKIKFDGFRLDTKNVAPLHVDTQIQSLPSPPGTESPPLSPGTFHLFVT